MQARWLVLLLAACGGPSGGDPPPAADAGPDTPPPLADAGADAGPDAPPPLADAGPDAPPPLIEALPAPPSQRPGDPAAGWEYMRYGDFVGSGLPLDVFLSLFPADETNVLGRTGDNAGLPPAFNAFDVETPRGTARVVGGITCLGCHGSWLDGAFIPGLGNAFSDFAGTTAANIRAGDAVVRARHGEDSAAWEAYAPFSRGVQAVAEYARAPFLGPNAAFLLEDSAAAHRRPEDLAWLDTPAWPKAGAEGAPLLVASDVPAWWLAKKKNALYYNGMGRGDFAALIMQVTVVAVRDAAQLEPMRPHFADMLAWIRALEPPAWPGDIDAAAAERGRGVFESNCARCHGTYDPDPARETYPNLLVSTDEVGTDPSYAEQFMTPGRLAEWFPKSWYAGPDETYAQVHARRAYVAPPLDGVWATAPYLHNGSVPTLAALLESSLRPARWRRDFEDSTYDHEAVGWPYTVPEGALDTWVYDTTVPGYSNGGHLYGDALAPQERTSLIEYLKTL